MNAILPNKHIIGGYFKSIHTIHTCNPIWKTKCNMLKQTKRSLKLYAPTCMQTNNQNKKHEATLPLYLDKGLLFKVRKLRERKLNKR